jgi:hypothetical protein
MLRALTARLAATALVAGLVVAALSTAPPAQAAQYEPWGQARSSDKVLRPRCHDYAYRYRITVPSNEWAAEVFLSSRGRAVASGALLSSEDPDRGYATFRFCRQSVRYGVYKIRMKVTWREGAYENHEGFVRPTYFRLVRG